MDERTTSSNDADTQRGVDRRKFLIGTTAVTAGAWAAPSILTMDRAFAEHAGSPNRPCACGPGTTTEGRLALGSVTVAGVAVPVSVGCSNDDNTGVGPVLLPGGLGTVNAVSADCTDCSAEVETANVQLLLGTTPVVAQALFANAACCHGHTTGGSKVVGLQVGNNTVINSTAPETIVVPGFGEIRLNEQEGADTFNAIHIVGSAPGSLVVVDLRLASARATCG